MCSVVADRQLEYVAQFTGEMGNLGKGNEVEAQQVLAGFGSFKRSGNVYTDSFRSYDAREVSAFYHVRINHFERFAKDRHHINGIKNFWKQAKRAFLSIHQRV